MKKTKLTFLLSFSLILLMSYSTVLAQEKEAIAVLDFESFGISVYEAQSLTNRSRSLLVRTGKYQVVERGRMDEILNEQGFQQSGCTSEECIIEVGQLLGVKYMLAGSIGMVGSTYTIDIRIIDIESGKIFKTASHDIEGKIDDVLKTGLKQAIDKLVGTAKPERQIPKSSITITSEPVGAQLLIENNPRGVTPQTLTGLPSNTPITIGLVKEDYEPYENIVELKPGMNLPLNISLTKLSGFLTVAGQPDNANIRVGAQKIGKTPQADIPLAVGNYLLKIAKPDYLTFKQSFDITEDELTRINYKLSPVSKKKAFTYSLFIPGTGQLYQNRKFKGISILTATLGLAYLTFDSHSTYVDQKDEWITKKDVYNANITQSELWESQRSAVQDAFDVMKETEIRQNMFIGGLGLVWTINLFDIIF